MLQNHLHCSCKICLVSEIGFVRSNYGIDTVKDTEIVKIHERIDYKEMGW